MFKLVKVTGRSMSPTLEDGDYVLTKKPRLFQAGLIYVIEHIDLGRIIKRLERIEDKCCFFTGDNPKASTPSSLIGAVERERITGQVLWIIGPKGLRRP
jgi:nickel-type superoxide dismutase maturation protease